MAKKTEKKQNKNKKKGCQCSFCVCVRGAPWKRAKEREACARAVRDESVYRRGRGKTKRNLKPKSQTGRARALSRARS